MQLTLRREIRGRDCMEDLDVDCRVILKWMLRNWGVVCGLSGSSSGPVMGCCEQDTSVWVCQTQELSSVASRFSGSFLVHGGSIRRVCEMEVEVTRRTAVRQALRTGFQRESGACSLLGVVAFALFECAHESSASTTGQEFLEWQSDFQRLKKETCLQLGRALCTNCECQDCVLLGYDDVCFESHSHHGNTQLLALKR